MAGITPLGNLDGSSLKAAGTTPITKDSPLPGLTRPPRDAILDPEKQRIRYDTFNMREPADISRLEAIETRAWRNQGVYVMSISSYTWMDVLYYIVKYVEEAE